MLKILKVTRSKCVHLKIPLRFIVTSMMRICIYLAYVEEMSYAHRPPLSGCGLTITAHIEETASVCPF